jgi:hypothetical protein
MIVRLVVSIAVLASVLTACTSEESVQPTTDQGPASCGTSDPAANSEFLPFDQPSESTLKDSPKKVFAHYFSPYPLSLDNEDPSDDTYETAFLDPAGESGKHRAYGGFLRERPLPRPVSSSPDWELDDMKTEVSRADAAGLDGFTLDILDLDGVHWSRVERMVQAAQEVSPGFKLVLVPDGASESVTASPEQLADNIAGIADSTALDRLADGRLVIAPVAPENQGAPWWSTFVDLMESVHQIRVALVPTFVESYEDHVAAFAPFSYGLSRWGWWTPGTNSIANMGALSRDAHSRGKIFMDAVTLQSTRPYAQMYWEAQNTENLRASWAGAIANDANWVQIVTWNDYSENSQISPSTHIGWTPLDLTSYYLTWFKCGSAPTIKRDTVYLSHRVQAADLKPTAQKSLMELVSPPERARDSVEVLTFLTEAAEVEVNVGSEVRRYEAPAGVHAELFALEPGDVSARVDRGGDVTAEVESPFPVVTSRATQDLNYYFSSSRRPPA